MTDHGMGTADEVSLEIANGKAAEAAGAETIRLTRLAEKIIDSLSFEDRESILAYVKERQAAQHAGISLSEVDDAYPSPSVRWAFGAVVATMANERPFLLIATSICLNANIIAGLVYLIRKFIG